MFSGSDSEQLDRYERLELDLKYIACPLLAEIETDFSRFGVSSVMYNVAQCIFCDFRPEAGGRRVC